MLIGLLYFHSFKCLFYDFIDFFFLSQYSLAPLCSYRRHKPIDINHTKYLPENEASE